jgi:putative Mg2+ transporter-C (MgtC) family protein
MSIPIASHNLLNLLLRLILALTVGGIIGLDRQKRHKAAGLRTHMLVSLGAALFVLAPSQVTQNPDGEALSRTIQGVATGVGFLGAGEILHFTGAKSSEVRVKGLTSAASIWVTAALGVVAGCALWELAIVGSLLTLLTLEGVKRLEQSSLRSDQED